MLLTFPEIKTKQFETENVRKQFNTNQNFLNIYCKYKMQINTTSENFIYLQSFVLELHQKPKSILTKADFA